MKKITIILSAFALVLVATPVFAGKPIQAQGQSGECTTIQDGELTYSEGHYLENEPLETGYDAYGYNYQAHLFNGSYANVYLGSDGFPPYEGDDAYLEENPGAKDKWYWSSRDTELNMKWNDAWLSNKDCDGWELKGEWVLDFDWNGSSYIHDMKITDNSFAGTGKAQFSTQTWTVDGTVDGNSVEMRIDYDDSSYYVDMVGTIAEDGSMSGTWKNLTQSGEWKSTSGEAVRTLDRHYGDDSYIGSGAWLTNHMRGGEGKDKWTYFSKMVAVPKDAELGEDESIWYSADGTEIGPVIWGAFAKIQTVESGEGATYVSPSGPGFGKWK